MIEWSNWILDMSKISWKRYFFTIIYLASFRLNFSSKEKMWCLNYLLIKEIFTQSDAWMMGEFFLNRDENLIYRIPPSFGSWCLRNRAHNLFWKIGTRPLLRKKKTRKESLSLTQKKIYLEGEMDFFWKKKITTLLFFWKKFMNFEKFLKNNLKEKWFKIPKNTQPPFLFLLLCILNIFFVKGVIVCVSYFF